MPKCGARTRSGGACQKEAVIGKKRCPLHGGKSTGPKNPARPIGNQNARKHGIYSDAIQPDEAELWSQITVGSLDDDIRVARLQLRRALIAQSRAEAGDGLDLDMDSTTTVLPSVSDEDEDGSGEQPRQTSTIQRRRRSYEDIINRQLGRIADMELKRAQIAQQTPPPDPGDGLTQPEYVLSPDEDIPDQPIL